MLRTGRTCPAAISRAKSVRFSRHFHIISSLGAPTLDRDALERVEDVAILGGGITGLASAYYIGKRFPHAAITIYEGSERFGGWLRSSKIDVHGGKVVFEQGPRTLLPSGIGGNIVINLIRELGLEFDALPTSKFSPAARNRYIYYPDHLVRLPSNAGGSLELARELIDALSKEEPLVEGLGIEALSLLTNSSKSRHDESITSFFSRNGAPKIAENLVSAMVHGIYAGDIDQLSMQSIFPRVVALEQRYGSISVSFLASLIAAFRKQKWVNEDQMTLLKESIKDADLMRLSSSSFRPLASISTSSVYTFKGGIERLPHTLIESLKNHPKIKLLKDSFVQSIESGARNKIRVTTTRKAGSKDVRDSHEFTHVISTIRPSSLKRICSPLLQNPEFEMTPAVTVMTVNLYYDDPDLLSVNGFGYLLPRSVPLEQNPERALGVVFDSSFSAALDTAPGTKLTVMLGGHWWNKLPASDLPDEKQGEALARSVLEAHLKITDKPAAVKVNLARDCIPQYTVGHGGRMSKINDALYEAFQGRLKVAGSWYGGVGVNDCIAAGFRTALELEKFPRRCGLEAFLPEHQVWALRSLNERSH